MVAVVVAVTVLALLGATLLALRWYFAHQQWLQLNRNAARDETVAKFNGRLEELEAKSRSWK